MRADKPPCRRSVPPTAEYVRSRGSGVDPQDFIGFCEAKDWLTGKTPMKDWKAACRNAEASTVGCLLLCSGTIKR